MANNTITLERLHDELQDILFRSRPFEFGLMTTEPPAVIGSASAWKSIARLIPRSKSADTMVVERRPVVLQPIHGATACIRWSGDADAIDRLKQWLEDAATTLLRLGVLVVEEPRTLRLPRDSKETTDAPTFRSSASKEPSECLMQQLCKAMTQIDPDGTERIDLEADVEDETTVTFNRFSGVRNALPRAFRLLCDLKGGPRLKVDRENEKVWLDGAQYHLDIVEVAILNCLAQGKGAPVTRKNMRKTEGVLHYEKRLDRLINRLKVKHPEIGNLISSAIGRGYWIDRSYLE